MQIFKALPLLATLITPIALLTPSSARAADATHEGRPNVLMICIDDLNDWVGHLGGHPQAVTPNIDALAAHGRVFTNAHCVVPVCSPSRVSVISGLHATTHGSYELGPEYTTIERLRHVPTMHAYFKEHGYTTLTGGKVLHHGFVGRLSNDIDRLLVKRQNGPRPKRPMNWPKPIWDFGPFPESDSQTSDFQLAEVAAQTLQEKFDQPFFMSVGFYRPHVPLYAPPKWFEMFDTNSIILPKAPLEDLDDIPGNFIGLIQAAPTHEQVTSAGKWVGFVQAYLASTSFVDHCVGTVIAGLDRSPHRDNTIVILWSDHGFHLGEKQHWAKRTLWEESTRVPLIFTGPDIVPGEACVEAVSLLDIYPTLVDVCGLPENPELDGMSLAPQLANPKAKREQPVVTSSYEGNHAIRSRDWRYIRYVDGAEELYDHRIDQEETTNLASIPKFAAIKTQLAKFIPTVAASEVKPPESREQRDKTTQK